MVTIDLSLFSTPEGKQELAKTLVKAVHEDGFFYVKNFNISQERVNRQFHYGKQFYELPLEEKLKYVPSGLGKLLISTVRYNDVHSFADEGAFNGYVPAGRRMYVSRLLNPFCKC